MEDKKDFDVLPKIRKEEEVIEEARLLLKEAAPQNMELDFNESPFEMSYEAILKKWSQSPTELECPKNLVRSAVYSTKITDASNPRLASKLKPYEEFTEGKSYNIHKEVTYERGPIMSVYYVVIDDNGNKRHIDHTYFKNEEVNAIADEILDTIEDMCDWNENQVVELLANNIQEMERIADKFTSLLAETKKAQYYFQYKQMKPLEKRFNERDPFNLLSKETILTVKDGRVEIEERDKR